jgi:hypothetical protein
MMTNASLQDKIDSCTKVYALYNVYLFNYGLNYFNLVVRIKFLLNLKQNIENIYLLDYLIR